MDQWWELAECRVICLPYYFYRSFSCVLSIIRHHSRRQSRGLLRATCFLLHVRLHATCSPWLFTSARAWRNGRKWTTRNPCRWTAIRSFLSLSLYVKSKRKYYILLSCSAFLFNKLQSVNVFCGTFNCDLLCWEQSRVGFCLKIEAAQLEEWRFLRFRQARAASNTHQAGFRRRRRSRQQTPWFMAFLIVLLLRGGWGLKCV